MSSSRVGQESGQRLLPSEADGAFWGPACLAGLGVGLWNTPEELLKDQKPGKLYLPKTDRSREYAKWQKALERAKAWEDI